MPALQAAARAQLSPAFAFTEINRSARAGPATKAAKPKMPAKAEVRIALIVEIPIVRSEQPDLRGQESNLCAKIWKLLKFNRLLEAVSSAPWNM